MLLSFLQVPKSKQKDNLLDKTSYKNNNSISNFNKNANSNSSLIHLQQTMGNQAVQRMIKSRKIQAKLKVSQPDDPLEIEADRVAELVMKMPPQKESYLPPIKNKNGNEINRKCKSCEEEDEENADLKKMKIISRKENDRLIS